MAIEAKCKLSTHLLHFQGASFEDESVVIDRRPTRPQSELALVAFNVFRDVQIGEVDSRLELISVGEMTKAFVNKNATLVGTI